METKGGPNWAGIDWSDQSHTLVLLDAAGENTQTFEMPHSAEGLSDLVSKLRENSPIAGVAIESTRNLIVVKLLQAGFVVYPINPRLSDVWRKGWKITAPKSDPTDAFVLVEGLRQHQPHLRRLVPDEDRMRQLTILCDDEVRLIQERTALVNRLKATLKEYYPEALDWFSDWTTQTAWDFILAFPRHEDLNQARKKKIIGFLKAHRIGLSQVWQERVDRHPVKSDWPHDAAVTEAKALLAVSLAKQLRTLEASLKTYRERIEELYGDHPDSNIFSSLPGAGPKLAPRLLGLFGSDRDRYENAESVMKLCGAAPVTQKSGKKSKPYVKFRRECRVGCRTTMHQFAQESTRSCTWAKAFYDKAKARGQKHGCALRNLACKWLKIIYRMWRDHVVYDESTYINALTKHGSPLGSQLALLNVGGKR